MKRQSTEDFVEYFRNLHEQETQNYINLGFVPCQFCGKWFEKQINLQRHERLCRWNPILSHCLSCNNFKVKKKRLCLVGIDNEQFQYQCEAYQIKNKIKNENV